jgi:hypothetical protein
MDCLHGIAVTFRDDRTFPYTGDFREIPFDVGKFDAETLVFDLIILPSAAVKIPVPKESEISGTVLFTPFFV